MKYLILFLILLLIGGVSGNVMADVTLSWTNATTNVDSSPYTDPDVTMINCGSQSGIYTFEEFVPHATTSLVVAMDNTVDNYCIATHIDQTGINGASSAELHIPPRDVLGPSAPGGFTYQYID